MMAFIGFLITLVLAILAITDVKHFHPLIIIAPVVVGVIIQLLPYGIVIFAEEIKANCRLKVGAKDVKKTGDKWDKLLV